MKINQNTNFGTHNTSVRNGKIEYIVVHYVGATGDAKANIDYYNQKTSTRASADFFVGHTGDIWQYNPDPEKRYCWAVGGKKQSGYGGILYGVAKNSNCISIEMCVKNETGDKSANSSGWNLTLATRNATVELVKYLMQKYGIDSDHVIRHFDVNGKACPGLNGWNTFPGNNEDRWLKFKRDISTNVQTAVSTPVPAPAPEPAVPNNTANHKYVTGNTYTLVADGLRVRKGPGTNYPKLSYEDLSANAKQHAYSTGTLKRGTKVTCKDVAMVGSDIWILIPSGWMAAYYSGKTYII